MNRMKMLALMLAALLALTGIGAFAESDPVEIEIEVTEETEDPVLASAYDGELTVKLSDVESQYDALLASYISYYAQYGYEMDEYDLDFQASVAQEAVQTQLSTLIAKRHAQDTGFVLTDEKKEELRTQAQTTMDEMVAYYEDYLTQYGYSAEEAHAMAQEEMAAGGYDLDALCESLELNEVLNHLFTLGTEGVTVTDEEVKAAFDAKVAAQKETYADVDTFINDYIGEADILYTPENVRLMHCIYIALDEEAEAEGAEETADSQELTGLAKANEVMEKIAAGEDFVALMEAYNEDGSTLEQMMVGYPVAAGSKLYSEEFTSGAMAVQEIGGVSDLIVTDYGYFILRYAQDLEAGEADFEPRKEQETAEALEAKQTEAYSAYVDGMLSEAAVTMYDMSPLYHIYVSEVVEATVAYAIVNEETELTDMPMGDAVAKLSAGASVDILGRIGIDGEEYAFVAVPGTAFKGYVNTAKIANMEPDEALTVDNTALAAACEIAAKLPTFTITMNDGSVVYGELYPDVTPESVGNFIALANSGFYNGLTFHRVIPGFMIQGGDPNGDGTGGPGYAIKGEFSNNGVQNDLSHTRGVISMARSSAMDSAGSQFFIMHADSSYLDGDYAGFGLVLGGIETVDLIASVPTNSSDKPMSDQVMREVYVETYGQEYSFTKLDD